MKERGIFERVRFLESRLDRLEVIILEQDKLIRDQAKQLGQQSPQYVEPQTRTMARIASDIASDNNLTLEELKSRTHEWAVSHVRQYAYAEMLDAGFSASAVGRFFGRDHSTVAYGAKAARARMSVSCQ